MRQCDVAALLSSLLYAPVPVVKSWGSCWRRDRFCLLSGGFQLFWAKEDGYGGMLVSSMHVRGLAQCLYWWLGGWALKSSLGLLVPLLMDFK